MSQTTQSPKAVPPTRVETPASLAAMLADVGDAAFVIYPDGELEWISPPAVGITGGVAAIADLKNLLARVDKKHRSDFERALDEVRGFAAVTVTEMRLKLGDVRDEWFEVRLAPSHEAPGVALGVMRPIGEWKAEEARLSYLASYDELTGRLTRSRLREQLAQTIAYSLRYERDAAYLAVGIDKLARINDAYGFDVADEVIVAVGRRLEQSLRTNDVIGRIGGSKFGVVLNKCSEADLPFAADRLVRAVSETVVDSNAGPVTVTVSIGGVSIPRHGRTTHDVMARAEEALDNSKTTGGDRFSAHDPNQERESIRRRNLVIGDKLVSALKENRIRLAYQPIVDARSGEVKSYEALMRVFERDGSLMSAGEVIPVAEKLGLVMLLDRRVLEMAFDAMREAPGVHIGVNISAVTATDGAWLRSFLMNAREYPEIAQRMTVEITETMAINDIAESQRFVNAIRSLGASIAIDDFGAGYTSFRNLSTLSVDMVKIDGSFIRNLSNSPDNQVFVRLLVDLAKNFNLKVVAEMVSGEEDAKLLRDLGVDRFQGFFFGKPEIGAPWSA